MKISTKLIGTHSSRNAQRSLITSKLACVAACIFGRGLEIREGREGNTPAPKNSQPRWLLVNRKQSLHKETTKHSTKL